MAEVIRLLLLLPLVSVDSIRNRPQIDLDGDFLVPDEATLADLAASEQVSTFPHDAEALMEMNSSISNGPYQVLTDLSVQVTNPGSRCVDYLYRANVYYPLAQGQQFPVLSWAHGYTVGGDFLHEAQGARIMARIASHGFVVIAHQSGGRSHYCDSSIDQINMIKWIRQSGYKHLLLPHEGYVAGYSMGGQATLKSASQAHVMDQLGITGAIALAPYCNHGCYTPQLQTYMITGGQDVQAPDRFAYQVLVNAPIASKTKFDNMPHNPDHNGWVNSFIASIIKGLKCFRAGRTGPQCAGVFDDTCRTCMQTCNLQWQCKECGSKPYLPKCKQYPCNKCGGPCGIVDGCNGCTWCKG